MSLWTSKQDQSTEFSAEPAVVAKAVKETLESINFGIKEESRVTGIIIAKKRNFGFGGTQILTIKIAKSPAGTKVDFSATVDAGMFSQDVLPRLTSSFVSALSSNPALAQSSTAGW